jgi:hypothetical protein
MLDATDQPGEIVRRLNQSIPIGAALAASYLLLGNAPRAHAQALREPAWPQPFQIVGGETVSFGFIVTQPGPITVSVASRGAPIVLRLSGPASLPQQQSGTGAVNLGYTVTAAEVQKSSIWLVRIAAANTPAAPTPPGQPPRVLASGTVNVQHPAANAVLAQSEVQRLLSVAIRRAPSKSTTTSAAALSAAYANEVATRQTAQLQALTRQLPIAKSPTLAGAPTKVAPSRQLAGPKITSLSAAQGQPGDPIRIVGAGLRGGEVHFVVNPGMDLKATTNGVASDSQLVAWVPTVSGVVGFQGQLYVQVAGAKAPSLPFEFMPTLEWVDLHPSSDDPDARIDPTDHDQQLCEDAVCHNGIYDLFGHKGDDIFYATKMLKNGWVVYQANAGGTATSLFANPVNTPCASGQCGDAYVVDSRVGTAYPYVKVHWWINALSDVGLNAVVIIKGPKGVPYW